jgi:hypothetical protein
MIMADVAEKNPGGRPCKFQDLDALQIIIDEYFMSRAEAGLPFTITGLALALDTTRETLMDIENENWGYDKRFSDAIKKAKLRCQAYAEDQMYLSKNPAGPIFGLKNFGWRDKTEVDVDISGEGLTIILGNKPESV